MQRVIYRTILVVLGSLLCAQAWSQNQEDGPAVDSLHTKHKKDLLITKILNKRDLKVKTDTLFVRRPQNKWIVSAKSDIYIQDYFIKSAKVPGSTNMTLSLSTEIQATFGFSVTYRGLNLSISFNPKRIHNLTRDISHQINYYNSHFGADLSYSNCENSKGTYGLVGQHRHPLPQNRLINVGANFYYIQNGKRYSSPAVFNHYWRQLRSAGSLIVGVTYMFQKMDFTDYVSMKQRKAIQHHLSLGVGYAYNWVPNPKWLVHISAQPGIVFWKKYDMNLSTGIGDSSITSHLGPQFPDLTIVARVGATYSAKSGFFMGVRGLLQGFECGRTKQFFIAGQRFNAQIYFGMKI